jgi:hypothetical protein
VQPGGEYRHHRQNDHPDGNEPPHAPPKGRRGWYFAVAALVDLDHRSLVVRAIAKTRWKFSLEVLVGG